MILNAVTLLITSTGIPSLVPIAQKEVIQTVNAIPLVVFVSLKHSARQPINLPIFLRCLSNTMPSSSSPTTQSMILMATQFQEIIREISLFSLEIVPSKITRSQCITKYVDTQLHSHHTLNNVLMLKLPGRIHAMHQQQFLHQHNLATKSFSHWFNKMMISTLLQTLDLNTILLLQFAP